MLCGAIRSGAVSCIQDDHHFTNTTEDTCAVALQGGCDLDCGGLLAKCASAVGNGTRGLGEVVITRGFGPTFWIEK